MDSKALEDYLARAMPDPEAILLRLESQAEAEGIPIIGRPGAALIHLLARISHPDLIVELGTATGYSGIWLLRGWPGAHLISFELNEGLALQARRNFAEAGLTGRAEVRTENAIEGLKRLTAGTAGIVFNDVLNGLRDEERVQQCFEGALNVLKPDGVLLADNALEAGAISRRETDQARCVHRWNELVKDEPSLTSMILPVGDGLSVAVRS
jgi:predicted O-methyltransferase YrrM